MSDAVIVTKRRLRCDERYGWLSKEVEEECRKIVTRHIDEALKGECRKIVTRHIGEELNPLKPA